MTLTLTMLRCPPTVAPETRQVTGGNFSIGRGHDNDWVLPDPDKQLSKQHCVIAFRRGAWQVAGTSTNGTFINRDEEPLESRSPRPLEDGDRLHVGDYEIEVRLSDEARSAWAQSGPGAGLGATATPDPFANPFGDDPFSPNPFAAPAGPTGGPELRLRPFSATLPAEFDPLAPAANEAFAGPTLPDHSPAVSDALNLPPVSAALPDDWDSDVAAPVLRPEPPPMVVAAPATARPVRAEAPQADETSDLLAVFLRGAKMETARPADATRTMEQLGAAFRALVSGIRRALIARAGMKREFRIEATEIRTHGNNLLKFSANDDDALAGLLGAGRRSDMSPEEAVADALTDIRLHELATMAAMQNAVRGLVDRLGPDHAREAAEQGGGLTLLSNRKARAWDAYETLHAEVLHGLSDDFDSVFGKRFARAYEQAMQELTARQKSGSDGR